MKSATNKEGPGEGEERLACGGNCAQCSGMICETNHDRLKAAADAAREGTGQTISRTGTAASGRSRRDADGRKEE